MFKNGIMDYNILNYICVGVINAAIHWIFFRVNVST